MIKFIGQRGRIFFGEVSKNDQFRDFFMPQKITVNKKSFHEKNFLIYNLIEINGKYEKVILL